MMKSLTSVLIALSVQLSSLAVFANNTDTVPQVHVQTNVGAFTLELYPKQAPKTVANFLQYARDGFYEGIIFHRLIGKYIAQAGGYEQNLEKKEPPYKPVSNEANNGLSNMRGTIAMAREADPNSGTSQFFINLADNKALDFRTRTRRGWGYAVFGRIIAGEDILDRLDNISIQRQGAFKYMPAEPIVIQSMNVDESTIVIAKLPVVSKAEETPQEDIIDEAVDSIEAEGAYVDEATDETYADAEDTDSVANGETADINTDDTEDEVVNVAENEAESNEAESVEEAAKVMVNSEMETVEQNALTTVAIEPANSGLAKPKAAVKPVVIPKNLAHLGKSQVVTSTKHLPEPPDIPAVQ